MAVLNVKVFGGLVPKASSRNLPDNAAQVATNLMQGTSEFRPMRTDAVVVTDSGVSNPKTIYRMQRKSDGSLNTNFTSAATWKATAGEVSYSPVQVNSDTTDRTIKTFNDGSAPARMIDATGGDRQLGVPKPSAAPTVTVDASDEFTTEERGTSIEAMRTYLVNQAKVSICQPVWRGADRPGTGTAGWIDRDTVPGVDPEEAQQLRLFRFSSTGGANNGTLSDSYQGDESGFGWLLSSGLPGFWKSAAGSGWPAWAGTSNDHWCLPVHAYGLTYDINQAGLDAVLESMQKPGEASVVPLFTSEQAEEALQAALDFSNQQWADAQPMLNALKAKYTQVRTLLEAGTQGSQVASMQAFYAKTEITQKFTDAVAAVAEEIWSSAVDAHNFTEFTPAGP